MSEGRNPAAEIFVVDDAAAVRATLSAVLSIEGYKVTCFADGASFLAAATACTPACVILDVHMPGRSGLDILKELNAEQYPAPIFIISGSGDIPMAVESIKSGAFDFIEKPFDGPSLVSRLREAIDAWARHSADPGGPDIPPQRVPGWELLSPRERDVLRQIAGGASNKETGRQLGISPRTVEIHRARVMEKLGVRNAVELVRLVLGDGRGA